MTTTLAKRYQDQIRKISRQTENQECMNCQKKNPTYVCFEFGTFICDFCADNHRNFEHHVKGISVSNFTKQDVQLFENGGNLVAQKIWFPPNFNLKDKPDPNKQSSPAAFKNQIKNFIQQIYIDKKYTTKEKTEEFQEVKRKSSIVGKTQTENKNGSFQMDMSETMTNREKVNDIQPTAKITTKVEQNNPKKNDSLLDFFSTPTVSPQITKVEENQVKEVPKPQVKKGIDLDALFSNTGPTMSQTWSQPNSQPSYNPNPSYNSNPYNPNPQTKQAPVSNNFSTTQPNQVYNQPKKPTTTQEMDNIWGGYDKPKQTNTQPQSTQQNTVWNSTKVPETVTNKVGSKNPFDTMESFEYSKKAPTSTNPFDDLDVEFSQKVNVSKPEPKPSVYQPPVEKTVQNHHFNPPPPQPVAKTHVEVTKKPTPVIPKLTQISQISNQEVHKMNPKMTVLTPQPQEIVSPKTNEKGLNITSPKKSMTSAKGSNVQILEQTKNLKGNQTEDLNATFEEISKEESNEHGWEKSFYSKQSKDMDSLRGQARKDPFESQFTDITPNKVTPFQSTTNWKK